MYRYISYDRYILYWVTYNFSVLYSNSCPDEIIIKVVINTKNTENRSHLQVAEIFVLYLSSTASLTSFPRCPLRTIKLSFVWLYYERYTTSYQCHFVSIGFVSRKNQRYTSLIASVYLLQENFDTTNRMQSLDITAFL